MIFRKKSHFSMKMPFKMAAKAAPLFCREAARINRGEAAPLKTALPGAEYSAPQAGTNLFLRPKAALFIPSKRGASGPTISFLEKETVPPGGTREKSSGPGSRSSSPKLKCAPTPHKVFREAPSLSKVGVQGPIFASNRAVVLGAPGVFSLGPLQRPVLFSAAKPPRPIWAAPQVRRPTQGARISGDRSLSNRGAPAALCAVGSKKEMVGPEAPLLEGVRSAAFGRKEKLGPLCGKKGVRLCRGKKTAPQAEACGAAVIHFFKKNCGKLFYWGYLIAAWAAARRAMGTRKGEQDT